MTAQSAPAWYEPVIPTVRAVAFTDPPGSSRLLAWLSRLSRAAELTSESTESGLLVLERVDEGRRHGRRGTLQPVRLGRVSFWLVPAAVHAAAA